MERSTATRKEITPDTNPDTPTFLQGATTQTMAAQLEMVEMRAEEMEDRLTPASPVPTETDNSPIPG